MKKLNLTSRKINTPISAPRKVIDNESMVATNTMLDSRYLRQSSSLIQDALQKGFDVLQLANGDIVTTGTKTVVHKYIWDSSKGKLVKTKSDSRKSKRALEDDEISEDVFDQESEEA